MSFTPAGTLTRIRYGAGLDGSPTTTARRTDGGNAGNGFQSMSSGRTDRKADWPGSWPCGIARSLRLPSPLRVGGEDVILVRHDRVAGEAALGVVLLRRRVGRIGGPEGLGCRVILERGPSPSPAVREPVAVLHHEVRVMQGARHGRLAGLVLGLLRGPMDLRHPGPIGERLAVAGNARLVGLDHYGIAEDDRELVAIVTDSDRLPILVASELGEAEATRDLHGISVLRRERDPGQGRGQDDGDDCGLDVHLQYTPLPFGCLNATAKAGFADGGAIRECREFQEKRPAKLSLPPGSAPLSPPRAARLPENKDSVKQAHSHDGFTTSTRPAPLLTRLERRGFNRPLGDARRRLSLKEI